MISEDKVIEDIIGEPDTIKGDDSISERKLHFFSLGLIVLYIVIVVLCIFTV